jgi:hypothetical protein
MAKLVSCRNCLKDFTLGVNGSWNPDSEENECDECRQVTRCQHDGAILADDGYCPICQERYALLPFAYG